MMMETYQKNKKEIDIVSVGWVEDVHFAGPVYNTNTRLASRCVYKTGNTPMMSMHGKVADFNHSHISYHHHSKICNDDDTRQGGGLPDMGQGPDRRPAVEGGEDNRITVILVCFNRLE